MVTLKIIFREDYMGERKNSNTRGNGHESRRDSNNRSKRRFSLPPTSSKPPMPPVKPPKKNQIETLKSLQIKSQAEICEL